MRDERQPVPPRGLPPGWSPVASDEDRVALRMGDLPVEFVAKRTADSGGNPRLGVGRCWELSYRYSIGDVTASDVVGRVRTRSAAIDGLLECVTTVHEEIDGSIDGTDVRAVLEDVRLRSVVPDEYSFEE